jgi:HTH-type transcriptional regulator/antitoxin HipB
MRTKKNELVDLDEFIDQKYGERGSKKREDFEDGYETFKLGALLQDLRKQRNLTQQELADRCGTTKTYISRIENDASDIRLSTLTRIIRDGLGAHLKINVVQ